MQRCISKYGMKELALILISIYLVHCCVPGGLVKLVEEADDSHKNTFTWLVTVCDTEKDYFALAYGSLIHPKAVLTAGVDIRSSSAENLFAEKNCGLNEEAELEIFNCSRRTVSKLFNHDDQLASENVWTLLILTEPFDITPTTAPINLVNDINAVNIEHCFFTRWMRVDIEATQTIELVTAYYDTKFENEEISTNDLDIKQLKSDRDWIIGPKFHQAVIKQKDERIPLNFLGSPLTCALKNNNEEFVQVGIATFRFLIPFWPNDHRPIEQTGSFIKTIESYDEIMMKLKENV